MDRDVRGRQDLYSLFASVKNAKEAALLLEDILTPSELSSVAERWKVIQALSSGMRQREINRKLKISISKITRGSRALRYGRGGFALFIKRMKQADK